MSTFPEGRFDPFDPDAFSQELDHFSDSPLQALLDEQDTRREQLFDDVRTQFNFIKESCSTEEAGTWQSFHSGPYDGKELRIWVVGMAGGRSLHVVANQESRDIASGKIKLEYEEYAISALRPAAHSVHGVAYRSADESWSQELLQNSAVILYQLDTVSITRGVANKLTIPIRPNLGEQEGLYRHDLSVYTEDELTKMQKVLGVVVGSSSYYNPGIVGNFY